MDPQWIEDGREHLKDIEAGMDEPLSEYEACSALGHYYLKRCMALPRKVINENQNREPNTVIINDGVVSDTE